jgi:hypothetical protein
MRVCKVAIAAVGCAVALLLSSCSISSGVTKSAKESDSSGAVKNSQVIMVSQSGQPDFGASVTAQAKLYQSTPGRVALAMLICKLDSSYDYTDLIKKNANELFDDVSEIAFEKNVTLESLDSRYDLTKILASEKIYVSIVANDVSSLPSARTSTSSLSATDSKTSSEQKSSANTSVAGSSKESITSSAELTPAWVEKFQKEILQPPVK